MQKSMAKDLLFELDAVEAFAEMARQGDQSVVDSMILQMEHSDTEVTRKDSIIVGCALQGCSARIHPGWMEACSAFLHCTFW